MVVFIVCFVLFVCLFFYSGTLRATYVAVEIERDTLVSPTEAFLLLHQLRGCDLVHPLDPVVLLVGHVAVRLCATIAKVSGTVKAVVVGVHADVSGAADET